MEPRYSQAYYFHWKVIPPPTYTVQKQKEVIQCITEQKAGT